jgi:hypothetical protein
VKYRDVIGSIGVLESPDNLMPIGQADCKTWDENGLAVWVLTIGGQPIAGRWVIIRVPPRLLQKYALRAALPNWAICRAAVP